jgi:hypothetical protein
MGFEGKCPASFYGSPWNTEYMTFWHINVGGVTLPLVRLSQQLADERPKKIP